MVRKEKIQRSYVNQQGIKDSILLHEEIPTIIRVTGLRSLVERERLPEVCQHYFLRLSFDCALLGKENRKIDLILSKYPR
jgi:hypothetical protein